MRDGVGLKWKNINDQCVNLNHVLTISVAVAWIETGGKGQQPHTFFSLYIRLHSQMLWFDLICFVLCRWLPPFYRFLCELLCHFAGHGCCCCLCRCRKVIRAYQDSWDHRCRLLFCCMSSSEHNRNSFADIARLLSDFFRELDVVPSDVVAGLVLLRKYQKTSRQAVVRQVIGLENILFNRHWFKLMWFW